MFSDYVVDELCYVIACVLNNLHIYYFYGIYVWYKVHFWESIDLLDVKGFVVINQSVKMQISFFAQKCPKYAYFAHFYIQNILKPSVTWYQHIENLIIF